MYYAKIFGKKYTLSKGAHAAVLIGALSAMVFAAYCIISTLGFLGFIAYLLLFGSATLESKNGTPKEYTMIKHEGLRQALSTTVVVYCIYMTFFV